MSDFLGCLVGHASKPICSHQYNSGVETLEYNSGLETSFSKNGTRQFKQKWSGNWTGKMIMSSFIFPSDYLLCHGLENVQA